MRDGHWPAARDLAPEQRNDTARRGKNVAEANREEAGSARLGRRGRYQPLAQRLRLSEHIAWIDGLVCGDQHEHLRAGLLGDLDSDAGCKQVVTNRLERIRLDQRHVLVGRRVENDRRLVVVEALPQHRAVLDVGEHRHDSREVSFVHQFAIDLEEVVLGVVDEDQAFWSERHELAAELGADRATGARDQHGRVPEVRGDRGEVEVDGCPAEHVLDLHLSQLRRELATAGDQLVDSRKGLDRHAGNAAGVDDSLARLPGR